MQAEQAAQAASREQVWAELNEFYADGDTVRETRELLRNLQGVRMASSGYVRGSRLA